MQNRERGKRTRPPNTPGRLVSVEDVSVDGERHGFLARASAVAAVLGNEWQVENCSLRVCCNSEIRTWGDDRYTGSITSLNEFRGMVAMEPLHVLHAWIHLRAPGKPYPYSAAGRHGT